MIYFVSFLGTLAVLPGNIVSALLMDKIGRLRMLGEGPPVWVRGPPLSRSSWGGEATWVVPFQPWDRLSRGQLVSRVVGWFRIWCGAGLLLGSDCGCPMPRWDLSGSRGLETSHGDSLSGQDFLVEATRFLSLPVFHNEV